MNIFKQKECGKAMNIEDRKNVSSKSNIIQNLILESREKLNISGALDVLSFDDQMVILETHLGLLTVKGEDLRISKLNIDSEEVIVDGNIGSLCYSDKDFEKRDNGFLSKIFK